jgi:hypothetical protein
MLIHKEVNDVSEELAASIFGVSVQHSVSGIDPQQAPLKYQ